MPELGEKTAVRDYFDRDADGYLKAYTAGQDGSRSEIFLERRRLVLEALRDPLGRVLDIGSGPGIFTQALLRRGAEVWVADLSPQMLASARQLMAQDQDAGRVHYELADIERLPFSTGQFETVLCVGVLQYVTQTELALRELSRVTRPGGQVVLTAPNRSSPLNGLHRLAVSTARAGRHALGAAGVRLEPGASRLTFREDIPNRLLTRTELEQLARAAGLRLRHAVVHGFHFPFTVPGLRVPLRWWDRAANRAGRAGWFPSWGREWIACFERM